MHVPAHDSETDVAALVRDAWTEVLETEDFADDAHFFSIGGNSIAAIRVMGAISKVVGQRVPVRLLFENQTVPALTAAVASWLDANK
ncbi:phosphopantetheine-binding protein [Streptomyces sp. NPDC001594]|uniref:phosphopantetheine-binding protein n=1 Tax=Streptomyces sp. NPDC001594 TaxID=3364590 RepID=UPI0036B6EF83